MSYLLDDKIGFDDTDALTAFGRVRTSISRLLFESRYMYGEGTSTEFNDLIAGAGALVADQPRNCYLANVGTASGDRIVRQSKQYNPYISGTSNIGMMTYTMAPAKVNLVQSVGLFDDLNGIFFRMNGLTPEMVIRKNGVDTEVVARTAWNRDRLDGTKNKFNPSGITIDFAKSQIFVTDYQWLGIGRVRVGFNIGGTWIIVHEFTHANQVTEVYMNQPSLPCRWEIRNVGVTASASQLMMICAAVYCEGSEAETGFSKSISTDGTQITLTAANSTTGYGLLGIRIRNQLVGKPAHPLARLKGWSILSTSNMQYKIVILPGTVKLGNPSITWTRVPGYGWCEYIKDFTLGTDWHLDNEYSVILDDFAAGASGNSSGKNAINLMDNRSNAIFQNYDSTNSQILAIIGYRIGQDATVNAAMNWIEVK